MNRRSMLAGAVMLTTLSTASLAAQAGSIRAGIFAGATSSTFGGADKEDAKSKIGLVAGGALGFGLSESLSFETGLSYAQRGAKYTDADVTSKFNFNYVQIPAVLSVRFPGGGSVTPYFGAGAALAVKVGCSITSSGGGTPISGCSEVDQELGTELKSTDLGLTARAGIAIKQVRVTLSTFFGLSSIDGSSDPVSVKNRAFSLTLGYGFNLK